MVTMIERVARRLCEANNTIWGGPRGEDDPDFMLVKLRYMHQARVAIEAMREPTEAMVEAVAKAEEEQGYCKSAYESMSAEDAWPIMIDAALKGEGR